MSDPLKKNPESRGRIYDGLIDTIGNTPLVRLLRFSEKHGLVAELLLKLDYFAVSGSDKDRVAFAMIEAAERAGDITPGETTIVEATSGNSAVSLAAMAAAKGYKIILTMPQSVPVERQKMLKLYGAELMLTPVEEGMNGATDKAKAVMAERGKCFMPGQFDNDANAQIHLETTAEEIWSDTGGKVDIFIAGVGTGGTIMGVSKGLKAHNKDIQAYAVEPSESPVLSGGEPGAHKIQGIGAGFVPSLIDKKLIDNVITIDSGAAIDTAREIAQVEGIAVGISTGANVAAAMKVAKLDENKGKMIVTLACSFAERYIVSPLFEGLK